MPKQTKKTRRKKRASPETIRERQRYARFFFRAAGTTFEQEDHDKLDLGILIALKQVKSGDLSDRPRIEVCSALCAALHLARLFPEQEEKLEDTIRFAYIAIAFAKEIADKSGPEHLASLPGLFDALDFGIDLYCRMHQEVSPRELLSALHQAQQSLESIVKLVRGKAVSLVLPASADDDALEAKIDRSMEGRSGVAWIHDAPTAGRYLEDERGYAWISDAGARIAIDKATPVIWKD